MTTPTTGGPAFPNPQIPAPGMTLRDWYAGLAMQAEASGSAAQGIDMNAETLAKWGYEVADAMLAERSLKPHYTDARGAVVHPDGTPSAETAIREGRGCDYHECDYCGFGRKAPYQNCPRCDGGAIDPNAIPAHEGVL